MKIVIMEPLGITQEQLQLLTGKLEELGHTCTAYAERATDDVELLARVQDADIIVLANQPLSATVINGCRQLKMLSVAFTGVDHIALEACRQKGVLVCNAAGYSTNAVAELTFGLAISVIRNIVACDGRCREGRTKDGLIGTELYGKTFGIVGTGAIGSRVAQIAAAFGCRVLAYSRTEKEELARSGVRFVGLDELLRESDIVSLHVPLTKDTRSLINADSLGRMKPSAVLINTARGPVVDSMALAEALNSGRIAGAGIDVFDAEPPLPEDEPLCRAAHTVVTPHIAFASREALQERAEIVFDNIVKWLEGRSQNIVK